MKKMEKMKKSILKKLASASKFAAVKAAVEVGAEAAAAIGKLTAKNVMPRPIREVGKIVSVHDIDE